MTKETNTIICNYAGKNVEIFGAYDDILKKINNSKNGLVRLPVAYAEETVSKKKHVKEYVMNINLMFYFYDDIKFNMDFDKIDKKQDKIKITLGNSFFNTYNTRYEHLMQSVFDKSNFFKTEIHITDTEQYRIICFNKKLIKSITTITVSSEQN